MTQYFSVLVNPEVEQLFRYEIKLKYRDFGWRILEQEFLLLKEIVLKKMIPCGESRLS